MTQLLYPSWKCEYLILCSQNSNKREENKNWAWWHKSLMRGLGRERLEDSWSSLASQRSQVNDPSWVEILSGKKVGPHWLRKTCNTSFGLCTRGYVDIWTLHTTHQHIHTRLPHFINVHCNPLTGKGQMNGIGVLYYFIAHVRSCVAI